MIVRAFRKAGLKFFGSIIKSMNDDPQNMVFEAKCPPKHPCARVLTQLSLKMGVKSKSGPPRCSQGRPKRLWIATWGCQKKHPGAPEDAPEQPKSTSVHEPRFLPLPKCVGQFLALTKDARPVISGAEDLPKSRLPRPPAYLQTAPGETTP